MLAAVTVPSESQVAQDLLLLAESSAWDVEQRSSNYCQLPPPTPDSQFLWLSQIPHHHGLSTWPSSKLSGVVELTKDGRYRLVTGDEIIFSLSTRIYHLSMGWLEQSHTTLPTCAHSRRASHSNMQPRMGLESVFLASLL